MSMSKYLATARYAGQGGAEIQRQTFSTGGFVLHRVKVAGYASRFSAWFDSNGMLVDAEGIDSRGRSRQIPIGRGVAHELQRIGNLYKPS